MFKKYYTTQMSSNYRQLQTRFVKMRSKSGRLSKIIAAVMTVAIVVTMACATIVMAAVGSDGLEYWDKNELYFIDGITGTVSIEGQNVPAWVYEDVSDNGTVELTMKRYELRETGSWLTPVNLLEINGNKGSVVLASDSVSRGRISQHDIETNNFDVMYQAARPGIQTIAYRFTEHSLDGGKYRGDYLNELLGPLSGKHRGTIINLFISDDWQIEDVIIQLIQCDEDDNQSAYLDSYISVPFENFSETGSFEANSKEAYIKLWDYFFSTYEKDYTNLDVEGVDVAVTEASEEKISVDINCSLPYARRFDVNVYNESGNLVYASSDSPGYGSVSFDTKPDPAPAPDIYNEEWEQENRAGKFIAGSTYRVTAAIINSENNVIYRWQEYVTVE